MGTGPGYGPHALKTRVSPQSAIRNPQFLQLTVNVGVVFPQSDETNEYVPAGVEPVVLYPSHIVLVGFSKLEQAMYSSHLQGVTDVRNKTCVYAISSESPLIE